MNYQQSIKSLFTFIAICSLQMLTSCQSGPESSNDLEGQCTVTFSVTNYKQINLDDLSSSGTTRATETIRMTLANLSLTVFDAETNERVSPTILHKSSDYDATNAKTFSQFSVSLPYGHYRVLVLGYNGSRECSIASLNHISWTEDYVPNTFSYCGELVLNQDANLNREITLDHVVAAFRVTAEDAIPAELKKMRFISSVGGTVLDATTGYATQNTGRTSDITVPADSVGKQGVCFTAYLFLPVEQINGNYTVQAIGKNNAILNEKHFSDVPLRINYLTVWQGKAFEVSNDESTSVQNGFNVKWDINWADTLTISQ